MLEKLFNALKKKTAISRPSKMRMIGVLLLTVLSLWCVVDCFLCGRGLEKHKVYFHFFKNSDYDSEKTFLWITKYSVLEDTCNNIVYIFSSVSIRAKFGNFRVYEGRDCSGSSIIYKFNYDSIKNVSNLTDIKSFKYCRDDDADCLS